MKITRQYHNAYIFFSKSLILFTERLLVYMISINESRVLHQQTSSVDLHIYRAYKTVNSWLFEWQSLTFASWTIHYVENTTMVIPLAQNVTLFDEHSIYIYIPFSQMSIEWQSNRLEHNRLNVRIATK